MAQIPFQIVGGIALGVLLGWLLGLLFRHFSVSHLERVGLAVAGAFAVLLIGEQIQVAGRLGVMTVGFLLLEKGGQYAVRLERALGQFWFFAQIFLFVLMGAEVSLVVAWEAGLLGLVIVAAGLLARTTGVMLATHGSELSGKERLFAAVACVPKATVQAAIGGIPLAMGIASGETILAIALLAVVLTASLGAIGIRLATPRLLEQEVPEPIPIGRGVSSSGAFGGT